VENTSKLIDPLPRREIAYYRRRQQNRIFTALAKFFAEEAELGRITRKEIADKLSKDPSQITRWLSAPSNLESDTISDILLAMEAEMDHRIVHFSERAKPNFSHPLMITDTNAPTAVTFRRQIEHSLLPITVLVPKEPGVAETTQAVSIQKVEDASVQS
jgi:hypothetical protein